MKDGHLRILLAGNPNSGKTTIFNELSGMRAKVGNYAGVTVERKTGSFSAGGREIEVEDLPGVYTLSASSAEEKIAADAISAGDFDLIVNVVDSSNFERNLFLTMQLAEMKMPMIVALNMSDELEKEGKFIDTPALSAALGVPVIKTTGFDRRSIAELKNFIAKNALSCPAAHFPWKSAGDNILTRKIAEISRVLSDALPAPFKSYSDWMAVRFLEKDPSVTASVRERAPHIYGAARGRAAELEAQTDETSESLVAAARYRIIDNICMPCLRTRSRARADFTKTLDAVFLNRFAGIPIFFALMYGVFEFVFALGEPLMGLLESLFAHAADAISASWPEGSFPLAKKLLVEGVIGGVGGVFVFLPNVALLFLALSILEDSGYMARAAFLCDRVMRRFGLSGSSVIPMLLGFGCSVPAIMATRSLKSRFERIATIMVIPLFSCGARFSVYMLLIPAFFAQKYCGPVMFAIYIIGIAAAMLLAKVLRETVVKGEDSSFLIELPPYRLPRAKTVSIEVWGRTSGFIKKAGTVILAMSIILWMLSTFPEKENFSRDYAAEIAKAEANPALGAAAKAEKVSEIENAKLSEAFDNTAMGRIGSALEPVFRPLGYDNKIVSALLGSLAAKEVFISQLGIIYGSGSGTSGSDMTLREKIAADYDTAQGISILIFILLTAPCVATIATTYTETKSLKVACAQFFGLALIAYCAAFVFYRIALLA